MATYDKLIHSMLMFVVGIWLSMIVVPLFGSHWMVNILVRVMLTAGALIVTGIRMYIIDKGARDE